MQYLNLIPREKWIELAFMCAVGVMGLLMIVPTIKKGD